MKKQVVIIHGGDTFETYDEYLDFLRSYKIDLTRSEIKEWKANLGEVLGDDYEVIYPSMPNKRNAKYLEWKIWFEKYVPHLRDGVILVGHSLGGIFLAKYLSENDLGVTIAGTILVAAPYDAADSPYTLGDFILPDSLDRFASQGGMITLFASEDDAVVPFADLKKYADHLPEAEQRIFKDRGHFNTETFPQIIELIQKS